MNAALNILVFLVAVTKQSATPSLDMSPNPAKGSLVPENEAEETMFKFLEPFSKDVVDDDAAHFGKSPSDETDAGRNPLAETSPSVFTDAGGDSRAEAKTESVTWKKKQSQRFQTKRRITTCSRLFQKGPNCEGCRMTTRARCEKQTPETRRMDLTSNLIQRTIYRALHHLEPRR